MIVDCIQQNVDLRQCAEFQTRIIINCYPQSVDNKNILFSPRIHFSEPFR